MVAVAVAVVMMNMLNIMMMLVVEKRGASKLAKDLTSQRGRYKENNGLILKLIFQDRACDEIKNRDVHHFNTILMSVCRQPFLNFPIIGCQKKVGCTFLVHNLTLFRNTMSLLDRYHQKRQAPQKET